MDAPPVDVVIAPARLHKPGDGDTFDLLVNFRRSHAWRGAQVVDVRLRGYRAQENEGPEKHAPQTDPQTGDVIRVSGADAARITGEVLATAQLILVEFRGTVSLGREVCDVWVQLPGEPLRALGDVLLDRRVVLPGNTMGLRPG